MVIPFRDRGIDTLRQANLTAVLEYWSGYCTPLVVDDGRHGDSQFNRSAAYNRAVAQTDADVLVFTESDMLVPFDQIDAAITAAASPGLVVPFTRYCYLKPADSQKVRRGASPHNFTPQYVMGDGKSIGAVNVVSRASLEAIGQFPEEFEGNWYDDNAVEHCFRVCCAPTRHVSGDAWHLYHKPGHTGTHLTPADKEATARNKARFEEYQRVTAPEQIRSMTLESKTFEEL